MSTCSVSEIVQEAQIMELLSHANIPTILGVQLEQKPFSIVMEFIGEQHSSFTVHKLLQRENMLDERTWIRFLLTCLMPWHTCTKKAFATVI